MVGAVVGVAVEAGHRGAAAQHEQGRRGAHGGFDDGVRLGDDGAPVVVPGRGEGRGHDAAAVGAEGGEADDLIGHDGELGAGLDALDEHGVGARGAVDEVDVGAAPPDRQVDEHPAAVGREGHGGPCGGVGQGVPHHRVSRPGPPQLMAVDVSELAPGGGVVAGAGTLTAGVAGVEEPPRRRVPMPPTPPGCGGCGRGGARQWPRRARGGSSARRPRSRCRRPASDRRGTGGTSRWRRWSRRWCGADRPGCGPDPERWPVARPGPTGRARPTVRG